MEDSVVVWAVPLSGFATLSKAPLCFDPLFHLHQWKMVGDDGPCVFPVTPQTPLTCPYGYALLPQPQLLAETWLSNKDPQVRTLTILSTITSIFTPVSRLAHTSIQLYCLGLFLAYASCPGAKNPLGEVRWQIQT